MTIGIYKCMLSIACHQSYHSILFEIALSLKSHFRICHINIVCFKYVIKRSIRFIVTRLRQVIACLYQFISCCRRMSLSSPAPPSSNDETSVPRRCDSSDIE